VPEKDIKITPENLLLWANMEDWENGTSSAPTEHTLSGAGASVARESTIIKQGVYSAKVTRAGADTTLYYDFPDYADYLNRKMTFGCWVYATVASRARLSISDGVGSTESSYHAGGSDWEYLTVTHDIDASATRIRVEMQVNTGNTSGYFDGGVLVDGDSSQLVFSDVADIGRWIPSNRYRGQEFRVARRSGLTVPNMFIESKSVRVEGMVVGATAVATRTNLDNLNKAVNTERFKLNGDRQARDIYLFEDRFVRGFPTSLKSEYSAALRVNEFGYDFIIPEPFFNYVQMLRSSNAISGTPDTFEVTVNGNAFTRPIIKITNDGSNVSTLTFENLTTNQSFSYTGSFATNDVLVFDTNDLTVELNAVDDISNFVANFELILVPGVNKIKVSGLNAATVKVDWRDRWY
jgi:phage-related protein